MSELFTDTLDLARVLGDLRDIVQENRSLLNQVVKGLNKLTVEVALVRQGQKAHGAAIAHLGVHSNETIPAASPYPPPLPALAMK